MTRLAWFILCGGFWLANASVARAASPIVPGYGERQTKVGDDFEDPAWGFIHNMPKSSSETDKNTRSPYGRSKNGRWSEGAHRGHPDHLVRVPTPDGGLEGSQGALLIQTRDSGIPRRPSGQGEQDDLFLNVRSRLGGHLPVSWSPSMVVRVFIPELDQWDQRPGSSFAARIDVKGINQKGELEPYWPGIFVQFGRDPRTREPMAYLLLRATERGGEFRGPTITEFGWWTMGMSCSADGRIHFFASPGVDDLTMEDHLGSRHCYGFRCQRFESVFFDVFSYDNAKTWSTPWIIDDPMVYCNRPPSSMATRNGTRR